MRAPQKNIFSPQKAFKCFGTKMICGGLKILSSMNPAFLFFQQNLHEPKCRRHDYKFKKTVCFVFFIETKV